jgi:hypothetical protein
MYIDLKNVLLAHKSESEMFTVFGYNLVDVNLMLKELYLIISQLKSKNIEEITSELLDVEQIKNDFNVEKLDVEK